MTDISAQLRRATEVAYGASYPPEILGGGLRLTQLDPSTFHYDDPTPWRVTAHGSGFESGSTLVVPPSGNYPISIATEFVSDENVIFDLMDGLPPGPLPVAVLNPDGTRTNMVVIPITGPPPPTITGTTPTTITIDAQTFTLHGTGFAPEYTMTYHPDPLESYSYVDPATMTVVIPVCGYEPPPIETTLNVVGPGFNVPYTIVRTAVAATATTLPDDETAEVCSAGTVEDVKAHVASHPEQVHAALDFERAGKNRSTLIGWLEDFSIDVYPAVRDDEA